MGKGRDAIACSDSRKMGVRQRIYNSDKSKRLRICRRCEVKVFYKENG